MTVTIHTGDCRDVMRTLPEKSVHTCISSPPYFGLRDYGVDGQIGLEAIPDCLGWATGKRCGACFVCVLVDVYREVRRVLRDDGTCWVNLGDSYANDGKWGGSTGGKHAKALHGDTGVGRGKRTTGIPAKNLMGMPWRVALALQADGWHLRQDIIWSKPNPMPESVTDRCTKAHEYLFLLSKSTKYYFDHEAIKEPAAESSLTRWNQHVEGQAGSDRVPGKTNGPMKAVGGPRRRRDGFIRDGKSTAHVMPGQLAAEHRTDRGECTYDIAVRNKRSVWTVATQPYKEAHFATFPPALIEPCVLAGSPSGGVVLDPFAGSGTTGEVAEALGRDSILIELKPAYAALAKRRTQQGGISFPSESTP